MREDDSAEYPRSDSTVHSPPQQQLSSSSSRTHHPFVIGIAGGSGSGKTTVAENIIQRIKTQNPSSKIINLSLDRFYLTCTPEELANIQEVNFDHVDRFDWVLFRQCLHELASPYQNREQHSNEGQLDADMSSHNNVKKMNSTTIDGMNNDNTENKNTGSNLVAVPLYSFKTHTRQSEWDYLERSDIIIVEGTVLFFDHEIRDELDLKLYVDTDLDECLARRIKRDIDERGRTLDSVLYQWFNTVKPGFESFIFPTRRFADVVIPHGGNTINAIAIDLMAKHIQHHLASIHQPTTMKT